MKKVIILTAAVAAFSFVTPQVSNAMKFQTPITVVGEDDDKYKEIKAEELPEAVTKSVSTAYTGYKIDKAYRGEDDSYKVKVAMGDLKYSLFYDEKGELIKVEDPAAKTSDAGFNKSSVDTTNTSKSKSKVDPSNKGTSSVPSSSEGTMNQGTGTETR